MLEKPNYDMRLSAPKYASFFDIIYFYNLNRENRMFIDTNKYEEAVRELLSEKGEKYLAVAFWGKGAEALLSEYFNHEVKMICNLTSGGTNPGVIEHIRNIPNIHVRQLDNLHAKVLIGEDSAIIGSANLSTNGLSLEGSELQGWEEAGYRVSDPEQLKKISEWYSRMWDASSSISDEDIEASRQKWNQRRGLRPTNTTQTRGARKSFALTSFNPEEMEDRDIYIVISREDISDEARFAYQNYKQNLTKKSTLQKSSIPPIYEDWPQLPKSAQLIDIFYGKRGSVSCHGVYTRIHEMKFEHEDGSKGHLCICRKEPQIMGLSFNTTEMTAFAKALKPHIEAIWGSPYAIGDEEGKYISYASALRIVTNNSSQVR
ncbi:phospholipase D family protein [Nitrosomonas sp. sh817]|uniref:phospholipase D family protein n=1 Tax=Nitrosomonas sp. sh817 TaxID=3070658 RepID=UPI0027DB34DC|nr:phospholipase D family protein [Nitrosomonas sp. sh817]WMJ09202.1 phospholipase D-like domain-containing protein [Nitrosomonas sp. sh817]